MTTTFLIVQLCLNCLVCGVALFSMTYHIIRYRKVKNKYEQKYRNYKSLEEEE